MKFDTIIRGGTVVTASDTFTCDVGIANGRIAALGENEVPTKTNPLGVKGAGESGCVGALPSVMNAVNDAMARIGAPYVHMPATPEKVWRAMAAAKDK
jgi:carbon-monoxide dehydrogenase large subunit